MLSLKKGKNFVKNVYFFVYPSAVLKLEHSILSSEYESVLADDDIMNVAVVIKDVLTKERFLATQEFNVTSPKITVEVQYSSKLHPSQIHCCVLSLSFSSAALFTMIFCILLVAHDKINIRK